MSTGYTKKTEGMNQWEELYYKFIKKYKEELSHFRK
jgi:hypothetical protein